MSQRGKQGERVNHPSHYHPDGIEAIAVIDAWGLGFCDGNALKYLARWQSVGGVEDLKKARFYIDHLIKQLEAGS